MKNKTYKTPNNLIMVKGGVLDWCRKSKYRDSTTEPYFYTIYVGSMSGGHICNYEDDTKILSIAYSLYSSDDPSLKFKVESIEEASKIVESFANGMNIDLNETIYKKYI